MSVTKNLHRSTDVFYEFACLEERTPSLDGLSLLKKWFKGSDRRHLADALQKLITYNREMFDFLGVQASLLNTDHRASLVLRSSQYVGTVPLRAPDTGKQMGDLVVSPRYLGRDRFEEYIEILDLHGEGISPDFVDSLPLVSGRNFRPPLYLEAVKFVASMERLVRDQWRKFNVVEKMETEPTGQVNWQKYSLHLADPARRLMFPSRKNVLSEIHNEYAQLRYVFDICYGELRSARTPYRVKIGLYARLEYLKNKLYFHKPKYSDMIPVRSADKPTVRECKVQANRILQKDFIQSTAWRIDFNDVFEKFVQHIFRQLSRSIGGRLLSNPRIRSRSEKYFAWELRELEPDAVFQAGEFAAFVDAKYKSHMFNKFESSELLKDDFRRDLHQVLAYTSFSGESSKIGVLCYPSNQVETKMTDIRSPLNDASNRLLIVGIPLRRSVVNEAVLALRQQFETLGIGS